MLKRTIIWLVAAVALMLCGLLIFGAVMSAGSWDFSKLSTIKYETRSFTVEEVFQNISIDTEDACVHFVPAEDGKCKVISVVAEGITPAVTVDNGTLTIALVDERQWHEYIRFSFEEPSVTLCLPQSAYGSLCITTNTGDVDLPGGFTFETVNISANTADVTCQSAVSGAAQISTSTGDITAEDMTAGSLTLAVSTGDVTADRITCQGSMGVMVSTGRTEITDTGCGNLRSGGSTGDIILTNVIVRELLSLERSTGDVALDGCDAQTLYIKTDTGDVTGSLLTEKIFFAQADTGSVNVPQTMTGGKCEIFTSTGDVKITIKK